MIFNPVMVKTGGKAVDTLVLKDESGEEEYFGFGPLNHDGEKISNDGFVIDGEYDYSGEKIWMSRTCMGDLFDLGISINIEIKENKLFITYTSEDPPDAVEKRRGR